MRKLACCLAILLVAGLSACSRPLSTALPLDLADIPKIQPQLDKLPPDERALVLAYLNRSKGDVLPAKFADPDSPFTARTFGEAIKLQRDFEAKQSVRNAQANERRGTREAALEPLREALSISLLHREIETADQVRGREPRPGQAINDKPVLVTTWLLRNTSGEAILRASGSITVRTESDPKSLMGIDGCYIDHTTPIPAGESVEVRCGNPAKGVGPGQREYVSMPETSLIVSWEPKRIELNSGRVLKTEN